MVGVKERKELIEKFSSLRKDADKNGVSLTVIKHIFLGSTVQENNAEINGNNVKQSRCDKGKGQRFLRGFEWKKYLFLVLSILGVVNSGLVYYYREVLAEELEIYTSRCAIENNQITMEMGRPLTDCNICLNLDSVPVEHKISADEFRKSYAYNSVPVLIKDATSNWTAMSTFSFHFFKDLYLNTEGAIETQNSECQFFPYNTNFETIDDMFNMSDARANFTEGEKSWYIGWSNCDGNVKNELRNHYQRPYFLPADSESSSLDWIFMGGSGPGALIHLDNVQRPSWQAQISGKKTWTLVPPPECDTRCKSMNVTVHKGDIFVVDTNVWYHSTFIHPGEISITIGSEYD